MSENGMELEVHEGESLMDAVRRKAKELNVEMPLPEKDEPTPKSSSKKSSSKSGSRSPKREVSDPSTGQPVEPVYGAFHVYQRPDEPDGVVRSNATYERKMHGPNVLVFQHMHQFGEACTPACREKVYVEKKETDQE